MGGCPELEWERERAQASSTMRCQAAKAQMAMGQDERELVEPLGTDDYTAVGSRQTW